MPTYVYVCENCNSEFEEYQSIQSEAYTDCPLCETQGSLYRKIFAPGIMIRGGDSMTLGSHADIQAARLSEDEKAEITRRANEYKKQPDEIAGYPVLKNNPNHNPWYRKYNTKSIKEIQKMTPEQKQKYAENG